MEQRHPDVTTKDAPTKHRRWVSVTGMEGRSQRRSAIRTDAPIKPSMDEESVADMAAAQLVVMKDVLTKDALEASALGMEQRCRNAVMKAVLSTPRKEESA